MVIGFTFHIIPNLYLYLDPILIYDPIETPMPKQSLVVGFSKPLEKSLTVVDPAYPKIAALSVTLYLAHTPKSVLNYLFDFNPLS